LNSFLSPTSSSEETTSDIEKILKEGIPKTLGFIYSNVQKMDNLINGLLQISRTGRLKMNIAGVNMNDLIKNVMITHNFELTEISASVVINDLPACFGDEHQLNQLFSNITDNAIKYRDINRPLRLEISGAGSFSKVIYRIQDNGIGIPLRHLDRIWDVFYRVDAGAPQSGEGLGLSVAKRIVDKHKGRIWATSEEGTGTTFFIELPARMFSE
jgi:signal transduction histidine kinase